LAGLNLKELALTKLVLKKLTKTGLSNYLTEITGLPLRSARWGLEVELDRRKI